MAQIASGRSGPFARDGSFPDSSPQVWPVPFAPWTVCPRGLPVYYFPDHSPPDICPGPLILFPDGLAWTVCPMDRLPRIFVPGLFGPGPFSQDRLTTDRSFVSDAPCVFSLYLFFSFCFGFFLAGRWGSFDIRDILSFEIFSYVLFD